jgi:hypothetical protein
MRHRFILVILLLSLLGNAFLYRYFTDRLEHETARNSNLTYNLQYEMLAHDEDVLLLKKENNTLHNMCTE